MSPFFTIYGAILLILQYLSGFKISFDQLDLLTDRRTMKQIGIQIHDYQPAFTPLLVKVGQWKVQLVIAIAWIVLQAFYMMFFWLTFRQYINERENAHAPTMEGEFVIEMTSRKRHNTVVL